MSQLVSEAKFPASSENTGNFAVFGRKWDQPASGLEQIGHSRFRWVKQPDDQPVILVQMNVADIKMRVVLLDHFLFVALSEHRFPSIAIPIAPAPI
jgi:hypothetical protein